MFCPEQIVFSPHLLISSVRLYRKDLLPNVSPWKPVKMPRRAPPRRVARKSFYFSSTRERAVTKRRETTETPGLAIRAYRRELIVLWITHRIMRRTVFMCMFSIDNAGCRIPIRVCSLASYLSACYVDLCSRCYPAGLRRDSSCASAFNRTRIYRSTALRNQEGDICIFARFDRFTFSLSNILDTKA